MEERADVRDAQALTVSGAGALAPDADQAAGNKPGGTMMSLISETGVPFGTPFSLWSDGRMREITAEPSGMDDGLDWEAWLKGRCARVGSKYNCAAGLYGRPYIPPCI